MSLTPAESSDADEYRPVDTPLTKFEAQFLSSLLCRFFWAYTPVFQESSSHRFLSACMLERAFRLGFEYFCKDSGDSAPVFLINVHVADHFVESLTQIRYLIAEFTNSHNQLWTLGPFSGIYEDFSAAQIWYPMEPDGIFQLDHWLRPFASAEELLDSVRRAQLWAIGLQAALHCLAAYEGWTPEDCRLYLPAFPIAHVEWAFHAYIEQERCNNPLLAAPTEYISHRGIVSIPFTQSLVYSSPLLLSGWPIPLMSQPSVGESETLRAHPRITQHVRFSDELPELDYSQNFAIRPAERPVTNPIVAVEEFLDELWSELSSPSDSSAPSSPDETLWDY